MQMWRAEPFLHEETFGTDTGSKAKDSRVMHNFAQVFSLLFPRFIFFFKMRVDLRSLYIPVPCMQILAHSL